MNCNQGDVVLLHFPYTDLSSSKQRPALVLSSDSFNLGSRDVVCCLITTNPESDSFTVRITVDDVESGSLHFDSMVRPYRLFTADQKVVVKKLCRLKIEKFNKVIQKLTELFPRKQKEVTTSRKIT